MEWYFTIWSNMNSCRHYYQNMTPTVQHIFGCLELISQGECHVLTVANHVGITTNLTSDSASMTGGLVQEFHHSILPSVKPLDTAILTLLSIVVIHTLY